MWTGPFWVRNVNAVRLSVSARASEETARTFSIPYQSPIATSFLAVKVSINNMVDAGLLGNGCIAGIISVVIHAAETMAGTEWISVRWTGSPFLLPVSLSKWSMVD